MTSGLAGVCGGTVESLRFVHCRRQVNYVPLRRCKITHEDTDLALFMLCALLGLESAAC